MARTKNAVKPPPKVANSAPPIVVPPTLDDLRKAYAREPIESNLLNLRLALIAAMEEAADRDKYPDFNRLLVEADSRFVDDPLWKESRPVLMARGGRLLDALQAVDASPNPENARLHLLAQASDRAVRLNAFGDLPSELSDAFKAVMTAFKQYEVGNDDAARAALEAVGMRSPFSDWKLLIRGFIAFSNEDVPRALENWQRLDPKRLPSRLAAPYQMAIDPTFKLGLAPERAEILQQQLATLRANPVVDGLQRLARTMARSRDLDATFVDLGNLLPTIKRTAPFLVQRLANCIYERILKSGQPEDLPRYRTQFGSSPTDPYFYKLQALVGEKIDDHAMARLFWMKYEAWLASNPIKWPADLLNRARALIWQRVGDNLMAERDEAGEDDDYEPDFFDEPIRKPKHKGKGKAKAAPREALTVEACFRKAAQLSPGWDEAAHSLVKELVHSGQMKEAETVGMAFLETHPNNLEGLLAMAGLLQTVGRAGEAATFWLRGLAINPLDSSTRLLTASAILSSVRMLVAVGSIQEAIAVLDLHQTLLEEVLPVGMLSIQSVIAVRKGQSEEAEQYRNRARSISGQRLNAAYRFLVDSIVGKLKPVDKKAAERLFAEECATPAVPSEIGPLLLTLGIFREESLKYYGQKTHEKKIFDLLVKNARVKAPEGDYELLAYIVCKIADSKTNKKFLDAVVKQFGMNIPLGLAWIEAQIESGTRAYSLMPELRRLKMLAERSSNPRDKELLDKIEELHDHLMPPFFSFFDRLRDRFEDDDDDDYDDD